MNEVYDLHVNNGRLLEHFHEGAEIKLISDTGEAELVAHVTDRVKGKEIYIPPGSGRTLAACLTHASRTLKPTACCWWMSGERVSNT